MTEMTLLSKSDFKLAQTCPTKLYYKKRKYPSKSDDDAYLRLLAKGGFMVEEIARIQYPDGVAIGFGDGRAQAIKDTQEALATPGDITLFEPTFVSRGRLARVDIFRRLGTTIELIEVKAKSWDSRDGSFRTNRDKIASGWRGYLEDVTFQVLVLEDAFPGHTVLPYLFMPDKSKRASTEITHSNFLIAERVGADGFTSFEVTYQGDPRPLRKDHFLTRVSVQEEVADLREEVDAAWPALVSSLDPVRPITPVLGPACFKCQYRTGGEDGFSHCWGAWDPEEPHLVDLYHGSTLHDLTDRIAQGQRKLRDVDPATLSNAKGEVGPRTERQIRQVTHARSGTEWIGPGLSDAIAGHPYPHHFIDFETSALAVPYHKGMRPYETVAFQWSCHTVDAPGAPFTHAEWINTDDVFPNFAFAKALYAHVGEKGTLFMWASHENTILRKIHFQMQERGYHNPELNAWIESVASVREGDACQLVDMNRICQDHYMHPRMGKRTSIKAVLDAVWRQSPEIRAQFPEYGSGLSPYDGLPVVKVGDTVVDVAEGTGAMRAYEAMVYGRERGMPGVKDAWRDALLRYCKLDTAAMVMIWWYWEQVAHQTR